MEAVECTNFTLLRVEQVVTRVVRLDQKVPVLLLPVNLVVVEIKLMVVMLVFMLIFTALML